MDMLKELTEARSADAVSRELGVDQETAQTGLAALLPAVLGGMQNRAQANPQGFGDILGGLGGGGLFSNVLGTEPTDVAKGNNVLGEIFGSKDTSRAVAADAAQSSGLSPDLLKKMLPMVAMLAAGYLAKRGGKSEGGLGGLLGAGGAGGLLGSLLGGGGSASAATANPLDAILGKLTAARH